MLLRTDVSVWGKSTGCAWGRDIDRVTVSKAQANGQTHSYKQAMPTATGTVTVSVARSSFWIAEESGSNPAEAVQVAGLLTACNDVYSTVTIAW